MNSIHENIATAMASHGPAREKFIQNLDSYVSSMQEAHDKLQSKLHQSVEQRNSLVESLDQLREQQREYFRAVKMFQEIMRENERLQRS